MSIHTNRIGFDTLSFYRRVVYTALLPFLERSELLDAMWIWEDDYASLQTDALQGLVQQIARDTHANKHNSILFNLNCHATDKSVVLEDDPYRLMVAYRSGRLNHGAETVVMPSSETENMKLLYRQLSDMNGMLEADNRYYTYLVRDYVAQALGEYRSGLSVEQVNELRAWMRNKTGSFAYDYSAKQLSAVMNLLYQGVCEYFGREKANRYHGLSLKALETTVSKQHR